MTPACGGDHETGAWHGQPCQLDAALAFGDNHANNPSKFVLSPHEKTLVVAPANDGDIQVWNVESGRLLRKHSPGAGNFGSFLALSTDVWSFRPDSRRLLVIANEARVWNLETRKPAGEPLRIGDHPIVSGFWGTMGNGW